MVAGARHNKIEASFFFLFLFNFISKSLQAPLKRENSFKIWFFIHEWWLNLPKEWRSMSQTAKQHESLKTKSFLIFPSVLWDKQRLKSDECDTSGVPERRRCYLSTTLASVYIKIIYRPRGRVRAPNELFVIAISGSLVFLSRFNCRHRAENKHQHNTSGGSRAVVCKVRVIMAISSLAFLLSFQKFEHLSLNRRRIRTNQTN